MNAEIRAGMDRLQALIDELETRVGLLEQESEVIIDAVAGDEEPDQAE